MQNLDVVTRIEDAHASMIDRVASYYERYVDTMWSVVVLHCKTLLGEELWPDTMDVFRDEFESHVSLEKELCGVMTREDGIRTRMALDELHGILESNILIELLAQRAMTTDVAEQLRWLSDYRLARHAQLRKTVRYQLDTGLFHVSSALIMRERGYESADDAVGTASKLLRSIRPLVVPT